jgi:digeranylgeranylglycerophospholipid reductase
MHHYDVVIAGGGPGGLAAAEAAERGGCKTLVIEQNSEIGSPTRTSGGSFIRDLDEFGIPASLYHPIKRCRFVSPNHEAVFDYPQPVACVMDVRGVYQHLAERAIDAGAEFWLATVVDQAVVREGKACGVRTRNGREVEASLVIDAAGYRSPLLRQAGIHDGFQRFGVGAEFDLYAPNCDQDEVVLVVGSQIAPCGYAWYFPWGRGRVRAGVGIIHGDSREQPEPFLHALIEKAGRFGVNLRGAQPVEYHFGLIPSDGLLERFAADGMLGVGDAAGQSSALLGEGIRWCMQAGRMAGEVAAEATQAHDFSLGFLSRYERRWKAAHGTNLRIGSMINKRIARYDDAKWDRRTELLKLLTPAQFAEALRTNFVSGWVFQVVRKHPKLLAEGFRHILAGQEK